LSRACLGRTIVSIYKWLKKIVSLTGTSCRVARFAVVV
jgi:hypothetical protein